MAELRVNPTRMELKKLKGRLLTAQKGHKLLKDKRDELMKQFLDKVREAKTLREDLNGKVDVVTRKFTAAAAETDPSMMSESLMLPGRQGTLKVSTDNIMSVNVPVFDYEIDNEKSTRQSMGNYGYAFTSGELDEAVLGLCNISSKMVKLAELEKTCLMLCSEIERTRRRVNALEYIMIPQYEVAIKSISMKLDENERASQTRLMKVKDMMLEEARQKRIAEGQ